MNSYDVIIIGAGPAGLESARVLQNSKLSILLLERNSLVGPKPCGGGITTAERIVDAPNDICKIINHETFILCNTKSVSKIKYTRKIFDRLDFGQYQLKKLTGKNVDIKTGVSLIEVTNTEVMTSIGAFKYKYLIGADGSNSIVRRFLKLPVKLCQGIYYEIPGQFNELVSYLNPGTISSGYIWEFPHLTHNNVGIYFDPIYLSPPLAKERLVEYINKKGYSTAGAKYAGGIVNYNYLGHQFGNIFLVGDAGGFTSRLHGGGINNAMTSGRDVANSILNPDYKQKGINKILKEKRKEDRLLNFFYKYPRIQKPALRFLLMLTKLQLL